MSVIDLNTADLLWLKEVSPDLDFSDTERQEAILETTSRDFNAVPGSGKTSLLAAKLLLIARKWNQQKKGLCVLSHTNVAREEITRRLKLNADGQKLLTYPHYIGTIHGFVNQYIALPALRSAGIKVEIIDDDAFAKKAQKLLQQYKFKTLRGWLKYQENADELINTLYFKGSELEISTESGTLTNATTPSGKQVRELKYSLLDAGIFRHRDMFAFAESALKSNPNLLDVIFRRFPLVFIDEMQDTSWAQESILNSIFENKSTVQRFGDIDQKILTDDEGIVNCTFPRAGHKVISTSKRFGNKIAEAVASVRLSQLPVIGEANQEMPPVLLLYKTADVEKVLTKFGQLVIDRFTDLELEKKSVRGMCTRKVGSGDVVPGRHLGDYWPAFAQTQTGATNSNDNFWQALLPPPNHNNESILFGRVAQVRRAILLIMREAGSPIVESIRDSNALIKAVTEQTGTALPIHLLVQDLILKPDLYATPAARDVLIDYIYTRLKSYLPTGTLLQSFKNLSTFDQAFFLLNPAQLPNLCAVSHMGRDINYTIGTVASMKGETHIASLVMESYGGNSKKFDLEMALPYVAGIKKNPASLSKLQRGQLRNLYVAMSRPTHFLCLAVNETRIAPQTLSALIEKGWVVEQ
ncbi:MULTISPECIES: UvrD-helicase domain-containing protein [unclassified Methylophilus]|jgi:DNA helicase-2/ATP-dependent DNA helicase PcrA|uniref:UvrD-helicase domain-containing protein n=1 Tax=Methylophilus glucosoxydans TaxID=752553 RepID=A0ABW3GJS1_9PROT|nr:MULTISPECIES: UvrD-helicase domain-containing protein [unclassified Methylophilus]MBF4988304.1 ATP-dependent helicase [Methylophilus sp. 14]MBF4990771.1 ATP-dependent helicase [Methylophilus sp. QUAN]